MKIDHLSYSSINQYIGCGLQYKFRKIDKLQPEHIAEPLIFGSCIHKTLARYNKRRFNQKNVIFTELKDWFAAYWAETMNTSKNIRFNNGGDPETSLKQGIDLLQVFNQRQQQDSHYQVIDVEKEFKLEIEGLSCPIIGYIDLIEQDEEGNIIITEYKTASKAYNTQQIDLND